MVEVLLDCDGDAVVYRVIPQGPACHTGERTCFHRALLEGEKDLGFVVGQVYATILERLRTLPEGSYVARMHQAGLDRILKKIGEEAGEVILAAKNQNPEELRHEAADLLFHLLLTLAELGLTPEDLAKTSGKGTSQGKPSPGGRARASRLAASPPGSGGATPGARRKGPFPPGPWASPPLGSAWGRPPRSRPWPQDTPRPL